MTETVETIPVERVQTGVRIEKRILKVLKAFADLKDITLGDLLEGIVLHVFEGKAPFSPESLAQIRDLKKVFELDLDATASHRLQDIGRGKRKAVVKPAAAVKPERGARSRRTRKS